MERTFPQKAVRYTIATLGVYEAIAIIGERDSIPTISALAWRFREDPLKRALLLYPAWSWLTFHLFTDGPKKLEDVLERACDCIN